MPPHQYSNRASSLTPTNVSFLDQIGAWNHVDQSRVQPYGEMQVWDAANDDSLQFDWSAEATKYNAPLRTVATMIENMNLIRCLLERISELGAEDSLLSNTSVSKIENGLDDPKGFNLSTWPVLSLKSASSAPSSPTKVAARLLIGADGFNSPVRTFAGIASHGWDYDRHGVVATLQLEPHEPSTFTDPNSISFDAFLSEDSQQAGRATAYQRFLPSLGGPIAILPLPDNHASLVWSTTPEIASRLKSLSPESFVATVNAALRLRQTDIKYLLSLPTSSTEHANELNWRLGQTKNPPVPSCPTVSAVQEGTVASFPLRLRHTTSLTAPHITLAGDAAHTIHPLAGQGLNLGLGDAAALAKTIAYAVEHGMDIGASTTLDKYASERFGKGLLMALGTDGLNWLYQLGGGSGGGGGGGSGGGGSNDIGRGIANGEGEDSMLGSLMGKARGIGMRVVGSVPGLKEFVMRRAE